MHWRGIRAKILLKIGKPPKIHLEPKSLRVNRALGRINATPEEAQRIRKITAQMIRRMRRNKTMGFGFVAEEDQLAINAKTETEELLGKGRADKFFTLCNDPYF